MIRLAAIVLLVALPVLAWAPAAGASSLSANWPSVSLSGLRSLLSGPGKAPEIPRQLQGRAAGSHQVTAAVTRAGRGKGRPPGQGHGQLPAYHARSVPSRTDTTPADSRGGTGFSKKTSKLVKSATSAASDLYQNQDGSYTQFVYASPVNYLDSAGDYTPIQTSLVPAGSNWQEQANSLSVQFAGSADGSGLMSVGLGGGQSLQLSLAGAASAAGSVSGSAITYSGALTGTNIEQTGLATGVNQSITLTSSSAPPSLVFPLQLTGLTAVAEPDGSVDLVSSSGAVAWTFGPGEASDAQRGAQSEMPLATTTATWQIITYDGGQALQLSLPAAWLADPARVFPVTIQVPDTVPDQSGPAATTTASAARPVGSGHVRGEAAVPASTKGDEGATGTTYTQTGSSGVDHSQDNLMLMGTYDGGQDIARTFFKFGNLDGDLANNHVTSATLHVWVAYAWTCAQGEPWDVYPVTESWSLTSISSPGPSTGSSIGESDSQAPSSACGNTALDPGVGGMISDQLSTGTFNNWILGNTTNYGLSLRGATPITTTSGRSWTALTRRTRRTWSCSTRLIRRRRSTRCTRRTTTTPPR